jgi:hypothetical protein
MADGVSYHIRSHALHLRGWRYLWLKTVEGFNENVHCARCLVGKFDKNFGLKSPINRDVELAYPEGTILYFCGVAQPYNWANNAHLAGRVKRGAMASLDLWTKDMLVIRGLEAIPIDKSVSDAKFGDRSRNYLTCRNFQFGAQMFCEAA